MLFLKVKSSQGKTRFHSVKDDDSAVVTNGVVENECILKGIIIKVFKLKIKCFTPLLRKL